MKTVKIEKCSLQQLEDLIEKIKPIYNKLADKNDKEMSNELSKYSIEENIVNVMRGQIRDTGLCFLK